MFWFGDSVQAGKSALWISCIINISMNCQRYLDEATAATMQFVSMNRLHEYTGLPQDRPYVQEVDAKHTGIKAKVYNDV